MHAKLLSLCVVLQTASSFVKASEQKVAMDQIILANMGKEKWMDVHKFDIRLPPFRSGAGEGEFDAAARDESKIWSRGVIPYVIDKSILDRPTFKANLEMAMKEWKTYTCIKFRKRKRKHRDYVVFMYGVGCNADVGRTGGRQYVSLGRGCSDTSVIIHEIGHVAGFWHEQNRPDRSNYVDILWDNIVPAYRYAFNKYNELRINSRNVTYDFKSIMHYGESAFSSNRRATIVAKNSNVTEFGNIHLSPLDIQQANLMYNCPVRVTKFPIFPGDFEFSTATVPGKRCIILNEPRERSRQSIRLCHNITKKDPGISWSHEGRLPSLDCTRINSPYGGDSMGFWNDNYVCVANDSVYRFHWSRNGPIEGLGCLGWPSKSRRGRTQAFLCAKFFDGPIDGGWTDWSPWTRCNKVCGGGYQEKRRYCTNPVPRNYGKPCYGQDFERRYCNLQECAERPEWPADFMFKHVRYTPYDQNCVRIYERSSDLVWRNYFFCSVGTKRSIRMKWSDMGAQRGMRCIKVNEPLESDGWNDNYLCVPRDSEYRFQWSHSGPIHGLACIRWYARNGTNGWDNNYLCGQRHTGIMAISAAFNQAPRAANENRRTVVTNGVWSAWSSWTRCSKTCGHGNQRRTRTCRGGRHCSGERMETRECTVAVCPNSCNGVLREDQGSLISPNFPSYPQNSRCEWKIIVGTGKKIKIKFNYMRLKANYTRCSLDNLIVRDGDNSQAPILKLFCSNLNSVVTVESTGNSMLLQMRASDKLRRGGFKAQWTSEMQGRQVSCDMKLTGNSGILTSPLYPRTYPSNTECTWLITVPVDRVLQVRFQDFSLEKHSKCSYDKVEVYDGGSVRSPKKTYCGGENPGTITAFTNRMIIKFRSDATRNYRGFKLLWFTTRRRF